MLYRYTIPILIEGAVVNHCSGTIDVPTPHTWHLMTLIKVFIHHRVIDSQSFVARIASHFHALTFGGAHPHTVHLALPICAGVRRPSRLEAPILSTTAATPL